jgi:hypothetical protein
MLFMVPPWKTLIQTIVTILLQKSIYNGHFT